MTPKPRPAKTPANTPAKPPAKTSARTPPKASRPPSGATPSSARQRREAQRAEVLRLEQRRRTRLRVGIPIVLVLAVLLGLVVVKLATGSTPKSGTAAQPVASSVVAAVTNIPLVALNQIGTGTLVTPPKSVTGQPALTADAKPRVLYVGAEYCPFCAAERWPVVAALSRFGTFTNLGQTTSAPSPEAFPSTATLSFHGATYTSTYLSFTGVETESNQVANGNYTPLDTLSATDTTLFKKYDAKPYTDSGGGIPFVDFGNRYFVYGASYDPGVLKDKTHAQIAAALSDPTTAIAKGVGGTTNVLTAVLCQLTGDKPATVCTASAVVAAKAKLS